MPDAGRGHGQVEARVQDGKRAAVAPGVVPGGPGVRADQVPERRGRGRAAVPAGRQHGGGAQQEPQARRVGNTAVQAQAGGGVRRLRRQTGSSRGQDAHPDRAAAVRQFRVRRLAGVVRGRRGRGQVVRRPAPRRAGRVTQQAEQPVPGRPEQQPDAAHTRGPADVVPVPGLGVVVRRRRRRRQPVPAHATAAGQQQRRRWQREVVRLAAAGRGGLAAAPRAQEHRVLFAPYVVRGQQVAQLRLGTVVGRLQARPDAAQEAAAPVAATAEALQQRRGRLRGGGRCRPRRRTAQPAPPAPAPQRRRRPRRRRPVRHQQHHVVNRVAPAPAPALANIIPVLFFFPMFHYVSRKDKKM